MNHKSNQNVIYELFDEDIQTVAAEVLGHELTHQELGPVRESIDKYIDWFQAIESAISDNYPKTEKRDT